MVSPYRNETIETVVNIMRNAKRDADRLAAAKLLLSYDFGLPVQSVNYENHSEIPIFTGIDLSVIDD